MRKTFSVVCLLLMMSGVSNAMPISPGVGYQAVLSMEARNVSGTATIVDADTIRFDDFTYDGRASYVYFYLGAADTDGDFTTGLRIGTLLSGTAFDGTQGPVFVDLPIGDTVDGYHAVSVWCERFNANFGSGTFLAVPEPTALALIALGGLGMFFWRRRFASIR